MDPLETLFDDARGGLPLPAPLRDLYGGDLDLEPGTVYSNFVSSIDGVVALNAPGVSSGGAISGRSEADRFVMGLLRACADCVLIGAQTARDDAGHLWTPDYIHPASAPAFAELRDRLGLAPRPALAVLTSSAELDPSERAYQEGALILTTSRGAAGLRQRMPPATEVVDLGDTARVDAQAAVGELGRRFPGGRVLSEGGPHVIGWLLAAGLLDEVFLTLSPVLAGRGSVLRPGMVAGIELLPTAGRWSRLRSARRHGSHLFLRYDLDDVPAGGAARA